MAKKARAESYDDLIFQLGNLARERLAEKRSRPRAMERVFRAEDAVVALQQELEEIERQMDEEEERYKGFLERLTAERGEQKEITRKWAKAVEGVEGRTKELRKKLVGKRAERKYEREGIRTAEQKHKDLEMTDHHDTKKVALSAENLRKLRLIFMRHQRDIEELELEIDQLLTPKPGQPGAQGILAHRRLLELEDEAEERKEENATVMADLEQTAAEKEAELISAEEFLDQALFVLGEECYDQRIADPELAAFYPRIDRAE